MLDFPLRILLVTALVLWSPAWCCCALRATINGEAQIGDATTTLCEGRWGGDDRATDIAPCCLMKAADRHTNDDRDDDACCDSDSECQCDQRPDELVRLNTAATVTIPLLERIAPMRIAAHELVPPADDGTAYFFDAPEKSAHAPPRTLFAQRCLLLT